MGRRRGKRRRETHVRELIVQGIDRPDSVRLDSTRTARSSAVRGLSASNRSRARRAVDAGVRGRGGRDRAGRNGRLRARRERRGPVGAARRRLREGCEVERGRRSREDSRSRAVTAADENGELVVVRVHLEVLASPCRVWSETKQWTISKSATAVRQERLTLEVGIEFVVEQERVEHGLSFLVCDLNPPASSGGRGSSLPLLVLLSVLQLSRVAPRAGHALGGHRAR